MQQIIQSSLARCSRSALAILALAASAAAFSAPSLMSTRASFAPNSALQPRRTFTGLSVRNIGGTIPYVSAGHRTYQKRKASLRMQLDIGSTIYEFERMASSSVMNELAHLSPTSAAVIFAAGILTSLSPCALSVLPFTVGYIGGISNSQGGSVLPSLAFCFGLSFSLSALGLAASLLGQVYGASNSALLTSVLPLCSSALFIGMGLTLLEILPLPALLPSVPTPGSESEDNSSQFQGLLRSFLFGASTALVATPCATPVLASLLAFIASSKVPLPFHPAALSLRSPMSGTGNLKRTMSGLVLVERSMLRPCPVQPLVGAALLVAYTAGYTAPVLAAGVATGASKSLLELKTSFRWVTPTSGSLLLIYGTYSALDRLFPA